MQRGKNGLTQTSNLLGMLEAFKKTPNYLVEHVQVPARRVLMDEINWSDRLIAIKGGRGVGKTDFLLIMPKSCAQPTPR